MRSTKRNARSHLAGFPCRSRRAGTPYFTENPGEKYKAWDTSLTFDYMPSQFITFRAEGNHRAANVPYFTGPGGNNGNPGQLIPGWTPDLRKYENRFTLAILVKF
jgi:hypothetical protein